VGHKLGILFTSVGQKQLLLGVARTSRDTGGNMANFNCHVNFAPSCLCAYVCIYVFYIYIYIYICWFFIFRYNTVQLLYLIYFPAKFKRLVDTGTRFSVSCVISHHATTASTSRSSHAVPSTRHFIPSLYATCFDLNRSSSSGVTHKSTKRRRNVPICEISQILHRVFIHQ
jgi:hypothetical protein